MSKPKPSLTEIAAHFGVSRTAARDLETQTIIDRAKGIDACRLAYLRYLRDRRGSASSAAEQEFRSARALEIKTRTEQRLHRLIDVDQVLAMVDDIVGSFVSELVSLPARCTRDLELRRAVDREVYGIRERLAERFKRQAAALRETGKAAA